MDLIPKSHHHIISLPSHARPLVSDATLSTTQQDSDLVLPASRESATFVSPPLLETKGRSTSTWKPAVRQALPSFQERPPPARQFLTEQRAQTVHSERETQTRQDVVNRSVDALDVGDKWVDELRELKDTVNRQNALLQWYQTQHSPPSSSSLAHLLQNCRPTGSAVPLLRAYEDRLAERESEIVELNKKVGILGKEKVDLEMQRENALRNAEMFREKVQQAESRNCSNCAEKSVRITSLTSELESLKLRLSTDDLIASKAQTLQNQLRSFTPHIASLLSLTQTQHKAITKLTSASTESAQHLEEVTARLEDAVKLNRERTIQCEKLEEELVGLRSVKREMEGLKVWKKKWEPVVDDYRACITFLSTTALAIQSAAPEPLLPTLKHLTTSLKQLQKSHKDLDKSHTSLLHKYLLNMDAKNAKLQATNRHLEEVLTTAEESRHARDQAVDTAKKALRNSAEVEEGLRRALKKKEVELDEVVQTMNRKLKELREQYDRDRLQAHIQIDELTKCKIELQTEIGQLLRDKRAADFNRDSSYAAIDSIRDNLRREMGVMA
ncbi:uncharacterized protein SPPG_07977 [Spizellomyces punctatus DAOM BR117]|uniref:Uncharacterized protein n=1 Tax=Spizellomyces punctatus (strain DAOM BR117) TaxID=645134 RepID=A0A0L0H5I3_SPIPD|nr:uncharacterized protein SPPG_07977 [Spizellomyces punctatus DAOM BR117]KNC96770.1 hypothetical protein SPPG_07977 [Spizellomyces punctatus DAOM BR117]|eukprot:XP_016604810.1 hypothetical protein SPPG_07977 [Spizellomyces punctatus DAOM BR117]